MGTTDLSDYVIVKEEVDDSFSNNIGPTFWSIDPVSSAKQGYSPLVVPSSISTKLESDSDPFRLDLPRCSHQSNKCAVKWDSSSNSAENLAIDAIVHSIPSMLTSSQDVERGATTKIKTSLEEQKNKEVMIQEENTSKGLARPVSTTEKIVSSQVSQGVQNRDQASLIGELVAEKIRGYGKREQLMLEKKIRDVLFEFEIEHIPK